MKKISVLIIAVFTLTGVNAQQQQGKKCMKSPEKVCRVSPGKKTASCYKTRFAQSFEVCKNEYGYYVCCETPGEYNTTYSKAARAAGVVSEETQEAWTGDYPGANLQQRLLKPCKKSADKVCRPSADKKSTSCYKTNYNQSFDVCKNEYGYYICCETPAEYNTTYLGR